MKVLIYFTAIVYVQTVVIDNFDQEKPDHQTIWLLYEVLLFYYNLAALLIFLIFSRFVSFQTLRERAGYGSDFRYKTDFLYFCKDDLHWFTLIF